MPNVSGEMISVAPMGEGVNLDTPKAKDKRAIVGMLMVVRDRLAAITVANTDPLRHLDRCIAKLRKAFEADSPW